MFDVYQKNIYFRRIKKKGFHSFNSDVNEWKLIEDLISFEIFPFDDLKKNEGIKCQIL